MQQPPKGPPKGPPKWLVGLTALVVLGVLISPAVAQSVTRVPFSSVSATSGVTVAHGPAGLTIHVPSSDSAGTPGTAAVTTSGVSHGDRIVSVDGIALGPGAPDPEAAFESIASGAADTAVLPVVDPATGALTGFVRLEFVEPTTVDLKSSRSDEEVRAERQAVERERVAKARAVAEGLVGEEYVVPFYKDPLGFGVGAGESAPTLVETVVPQSAAWKREVHAGDTVVAVNAVPVEDKGGRGEGDGDTVCCPLSNAAAQLLGWG